MVWGYYDHQNDFVSDLFDSLTKKTYKCDECKEKYIKTQKSKIYKYAEKLPMPKNVLEPDMYIVGISLKICEILEGKTKSDFPKKIPKDFPNTLRKKIQRMIDAISENRLEWKDIKKLF